MPRVGQQEIAAEARLTPKQLAEKDLETKAGLVEQWQQEVLRRSSAYTLGLATGKQERYRKQQEAIALRDKAQADLTAAATQYRAKYGDPPTGTAVFDIVQKAAPPTKAEVLGSPGITPTPPPQKPTPPPTPAGPVPQTSPKPPAIASSTPRGTPSNPQVIQMAERPAVRDLGSVEDQVQRNYGYAAWALNHPELGALLRQAVGDPATGEDDWDDARFQGALQATTWWKTTSASRRQYEALKNTDPQTARLRVDQQLAAVNGTAKQIGVTLDPGRAREIAETAVADDWSPGQINAALASEFKYVPGGQTGAVARAEQQLKRLAASYLVPLSDDTLAEWDRQIVGGADPEQFRSHLVNVAKGRFPTLTKLLDAGVTVAEVAEPYRQTAARELGISPDSVDFNDPKWSRALTYVDPKSGDRRLMDDFEWMKTIRTDEQYGWDRTQNGISAGYRVGNALARALGLRAT